MTISHTLLRGLLLTERIDDATLMVHTLRRTGLTLDWQCVGPEIDYLTALDSSPEILLADYSLPQFTALRGLPLLQERKLDIRF